ncbi:MAG: sulfatase-like hydrolase/transferase [Spirochaetia bacterium]|nr:sulfatase-like hydrolase/transferase [Spirochaetia bacterium]
MNNQPNILFIMTDQMRADALGCMGISPARTPHLDALAQAGTLYTNCFTNSPLCAPAQASLLAGLYPHQTGVWNNDPHTFPADAENWVRRIRDRGYKTCVIGKTHYYPYNGSVPDMREAEDLIQAYGYEDVDEIPGPRTSGYLLSHMTNIWRESGFWVKVREDIDSRYRGNHAIARESVLPISLNPDIYVGQQTKKYLAEAALKEPWFCFVSFGGPHDPWDSPDCYTDRFLKQTMPAPLGPVADVYPDRPEGRWDILPPYPPFSLEDVQAIRRNYAGKVSLIDEQIGEILAVLDERGMRDSTIVVFTSDHGEMNGDHERLYKSNFLESSIKVPLIIYDPRRAEDRGVNSELVELIDIGPTLFELAGGMEQTDSSEQTGGTGEKSSRNELRLPYRQFGQSLVSSPGRDFVISELDNEIMIRTPLWKMVLNQEKQPCMLFDLDGDPEELYNLAGGNPFREIENELKVLVQQFLDLTEGTAYTFLISESN